HPKAVVAIQSEMLDGFLSHSIHKPDRLNVAGNRIEPPESTRISADPQASIGRGRKRTDHVCARHRLQAPARMAALAALLVQSELRPNPEVAPVVASYGPNRRPAKAFVLVPTLPFVVPQPARETGAKRPEPDRPFAVLDNGGDIIAAQAVIGHH